MTEKAEKKIPLAELREADRERVLETMIAGIHSQFADYVKMFAYRVFLTSLKTGEPFDPSSMWDSLPVNTQNHFEHARKAVENIERILDGDPPPLAPAPKKVEPKKDGKKKGR